VKPSVEKEAVDIELSAPATEKPKRRRISIIKLVFVVKGFYPDKPCLTFPDNFDSCLLKVIASMEN
jgi:hypothetical protein